MHLRVPLQLNSYGSRDGRSLLVFGVSESDWSEQTLIPLSPISPSPINRLRFLWALPQENPSVCLLPQGTSALRRTPSSNNSPKRSVTIQTSPLFTVRLLPFYPNKSLYCKFTQCTLLMRSFYAFIRLFINYITVSSKSNVYIYQHSNNIIQGTYFNSVLNYSVLPLNC